MPTTAPPQPSPHSLIATRWSPRAFREDPLPDATIALLFEAARAAPSCFNDQPWRFVYATAPDARARLLALLDEGNRTWAQRAPLVGVSFARKIFGKTGKPNRWGQHDTGMAAMNLALQAHALGLAAHFMGGFDEKAAYAACGMDPESWTAMAGFVVGAVGDPESLPEPLRAREVVRSPRKAHSEVTVMLK